MADMMATALSALTSYQAALSTTSNNIANANTAGYSVETVNFNATSTGSTNKTGSGVQVTSVQRQYDQAINDQLNSNTSSYNQQNNLYTLASQVQTAISDNGTGINTAMSTFFNSVQSVSTSPTDQTARTTLIANAKSLASRFNDISSQLNSIGASVTSTVTSSVGQINTLTSQIATLNQSIASAESSGSAQLPNGLLDQRDAALTSLSKIVGVSTTKLSDGTINVYVGNGQPLVVGAKASALSTQQSAFDPSQLDVVLNGSTMTNTLQGGTLGGALQFQTQVLQPAQGQLGLVATALASQVNAVQTSGADLNGNAGVAMFSQPTPSTLASRFNTGTAAATTTISNLSLVDGSNYQLQYNGSQWQASNTLTGASVPVSGTGSASSPLQFAGLSVTLSGSANAGDKFLVQPTANAAATLSVTMTSASQVAAGLPDAQNGTGDNRNLVNLANVESNKTLNGGTTSINTAMGNLLGQVATATSNASLNSQSQNTLLQATTARQQAVSGVNLDEEAGNLMQYQQAYQAAAQVIAISNTIFSSLLAAFQG